MSSSSDAAGLPDAGFTGLEAAIVLIAFVVVAAVFAYIVLGTGLLFSGGSQSTIHQGVRQAGSACIVTGMVYGVSNDADHIKSIVIPVGLTAGGEPIDITTVSVRFVGPHHEKLIDQCIPLIDTFPGYGFWSIQERLNSDSDMLLEAGEQYMLNISPEVLTDCAPYGSFAIEIKPTGRAALRVERTVPGSIDRVTFLG